MLIVIALGYAFVLAEDSFAAACSDTYNITTTNLGDEYREGMDTTLFFKIHNLDDAKSYSLFVESRDALIGGLLRKAQVVDSARRPTNSEISYNISDPIAMTSDPTKYKTLLLKWIDNSGKDVTCSLASYQIVVSGSCSIAYYQEGYANTINPACLDEQTNIVGKATNITYNNVPNYSGQVQISVERVVPGMGAVPASGRNCSTNAVNGSAECAIKQNHVNSPIDQQYVMKVVKNNITLCERQIPTVLKECTPNSRVTPAATTSATAKPFQVCEQIPESNVKARSGCESCLNNDGLWTAIGCFNYTTEALTTREGIIGKIMQIGLSLAGGVALLMILVAAFTYATSQGEPKRTGEAKEMMTSAIIGLIFIIFSVTILQFIGVNILQIPGFGER